MVKKTKTAVSKTNCDRTGDRAAAAAAGSLALRSSSGAAGREVTPGANAAPTPDAATSPTAAAPATANPEDPRNAASSSGVPAYKLARRKTQMWNG